MSRISRYMKKSIDNFPNTVRTYRTVFGELRAINKKKGLYSGVIWSEEQEQLFNEFWEKNYGRRISSAWNKLYQSANGIFDEKYFPEFYYTTRIEPRLNPYHYCVAFSDKNLLPYLYGGFDGLYIPRVYLSCVNGVYKIDKDELVSKNTAILSLQNIGQCVIKPSINSGSGSGVYIADIKNGVDSHSRRAISEIFEELGNNYVVQEIIHNNSELSELCPQSLNTLRVITYYVENEIHCAPVTLRVGNGNNRVDNIHAGGLCVGVNTDGTLKPKAYLLGHGDNNKVFDSHPSSKQVFNQYYIGDVEKVVKTAIGLHKRIPQLGIVSWDLSINDNNQITLIEANCRDQSIWFPQIVNGCSFFGNDTEFFCKMMRKK